MATQATKTPVDSVEIPAEYVQLCWDWHGSIHCKLYAVCSTGNLTLGSIRPEGCSTDEQWYLSLWWGLASDVGRAVQAAEKGLNASDDGSPDGGDGEGHDADYPELSGFEEWCDAVVEQLAEEYGLTDWEV